MTGLYKHILFDLDGTLTDPADGIIHSLHHAFTALGLPVLDAQACREFIGPPLFHTFRHVCGLSEQKSHEAVRIYREHHLETGLYENRIYPGIHDLLAALLAADCMLYVATLKQTALAEIVLEYLGLRSFFCCVTGGTPHNTLPDKTHIIAEILEGVPREEQGKTIMVGDRKYDIIGAAANSIHSVAVGYGYGSIAELTAEHPTYFVRTVSELTELLLHGTGGCIDAGGDLPHV